MRLGRLADIYGQFPDFDVFEGPQSLKEAEILIRQNLPQDESSQWTQKDLETLLQLVRNLDLQGLSADAGSLLEKAATHKDLLNPEKPTRALLRFLLEQGRHLCLVMTPAKAQSHFVTVWSLSRDLNEDFFSIEAAVLLAISHPPKIQKEWLQRALAVAEKTSDERAKAWLSYLYYTDGWCAFHIHRFKEALNIFEKALSKAESSGRHRHAEHIRWSLARTHRALNQIDEALAIQRALLEEGTQLGRVNGHVFLEIAECLQLQQKKEESKPFFEKAYLELSADVWYADNQETELSRMRHLYKRNF